MPAPVEFHRCDGTVYTSGVKLDCQQRDTCKRYQEFLINNKPAVRVWVALQQGTQCGWFEEGEG